MFISRAGMSNSPYSDDSTGQIETKWERLERGRMKEKGIDRYWRDRKWENVWGIKRVRERKRVRGW